jgi:serine/threonine-protein kinase
VPDRDRFVQIRAIFERALEQSAETRLTFVRIACGGDEFLLREVQHLLTAHEKSRVFFEQTGLGFRAASPETMNCPACNTKIPHWSAFCPSCGIRVPSFCGGSRVPTETAVLLEDMRNDALPVRRAAGATSLKAGRFAPGTMLGGRFRIEGLLGKGGMGEVYRAYDAQLDQAVALKFLPEKAAGNPGAMARLRKEVRIARQVSHPNVCRVYDIGEVQGQAYIAMEYVDGENLASLLRRIGRVPADKAVEIARQLCAGLAAAHLKGVLDRDLKPANIMIDGRGEALITDFGIACFDKEASDFHLREGTPAYMAPEQLAGQGVSVRSELYALGLVLYEIFTGKRVFEAAASFNELLRQHQELPLTNPSFLVKDLDPAVESVILHCLDPEPRNRPQSAQAVAAALPGGDFLAAALAAGQTPSPEVVAAAGDPFTLHPVVAICWLALVMLGLVTAAFLSGKVNLTGTARLSHTPDVLVQRARDIINDLGYAESPADSAYGFQYEAVDYLSYVQRKANVPNLWSRLATHQPALVHLWYRQSPQPLEPVSSFADSLGPARTMTITATVSPAVPPHTLPGMIRVQVDALGRLIGLDAVPPQTGNSGSEMEPPDWDKLFRASGLNPAVFSPAQPERIPPTAFDNRAAWTGKYRESPDTPLHIEAAVWRGRPVFFHIFGPWMRADAAASNRHALAPQQSSPWLLVGISLWNLLSFSVLVGAVLLARHNLRVGRATVMEHCAWLFSSVA